MARSRVVFPQPLGPRRVKKSPSPITRETSSTALSGPKHFVIPVSSTRMDLFRQDDLLPLLEDLLLQRVGLHGIEALEERDLLQGGKTLRVPRIKPGSPR